MIIYKNIYSFMINHQFIYTPNYMNNNTNNIE